MSSSYLSRRWHAALHFGSVGAVLLTLLLSACTEPRVLKWEESVVVPDGRIVALRRIQHFDKEDFVAAQSLEFEHPTTKQIIRWESDGFFRLAGLFLSKDVPYIMVKPTFGSHNERAGCPYPPMLLFMHSGNEWVQVPYAESPLRIVRGNTTLDPKDERERIKAKGNRLSSDDIRTTSDPAAQEYYDLNLDRFPRQVFQCRSRQQTNFR